MEKSQSRFSEDTKGKEDTKLKMMAKNQISLSIRNTNKDKGSALKSKPLMPAIQFLPVNAMAQGNFHVLHIHPREKSFKLYAEGLFHKAKGHSL